MEKIKNIKKEIDEFTDFLEDSGLWSTFIGIFVLSCLFGDGNNKYWKSEILVGLLGSALTTKGLYYMTSRKNG